MTDHELLAIYLNDHLTGATGGVQLFRRAASNLSGAPGEELARLRDEVEEDRASLRSIMRRLGIRENKAMAALGWVGERVGRFKPNGYVVRRSPLSDVIELEGLRVGVHGKLCGWQILRAATIDDDRVPTEEVEVLIERAEDQQARLYKLHVQVAQHHAQVATT
jgi:hypothetical protein